MKKLLLFICIAVLASCQKVPDNTFPEDIIGSWTLHAIEGQTTENTDEKFVLQFREDGSATLGRHIDEKWSHNSNFVYSFKKHTLIIEDIKSAGEKRYGEAAVILIDKDNCVFETRISQIDGEEIVAEQHVLYKLNRSKEMANISGIWEGVSENEGAKVVFRYEFLADGTYKYYTQNTSTDFVEDISKDGNFRQYSSFIVVINNNTQKSYDISLSGSKMTWTNVQDETTETISLSKI